VLRKKIFLVQMALNCTPPLKTFIKWLIHAILNFYFEIPSSKALKVNNQIHQPNLSDDVLA
jgi:hypothetical protein